MSLREVKRYDGEFFIPEKGEELLVRYYRIDDEGNHRSAEDPGPSRPKNTLLTLRTESVFFFGIARCNFAEGDQFSKARGQEIALERLLAAREQFSATGMVGSAQKITDHLGTYSFLAGWCTLHNIEDLLVYFNRIDAFIDWVRKKKYARWDRERKIRKEIEKSEREEAEKEKKEKAVA
jgi:hypothetical protein